MPKRAHTLPPSTPLVQQVGGHTGVQVTEDESLLLKPALSREIDFYQFVRDIDDPSTGVHALRDWMPKFFGLLNLEGKLAPDADKDSGAAPAITPVLLVEGASIHGGGLDNRSGNCAAPENLSQQTLVLQNLLYGYRKPCVLDVKLGTVLYDEDTPETKKVRMIKKAAETTSLLTGVRLTGFQVYSNHELDPIVYGREYGYGLKPEQLHEGISHFLPCSGSICTNRPESSLSDASSGLPENILLPLLASLHDSLTELRRSLKDAHLRLVGSSVLIIYEGDWERATMASGRGGGPGEEEEECDGDDEDQIEVEVDEQGEIVMESIPDATSSSSSSHTDTHPRLYTVALIDFAHTRILPGQGPDEGVLKGMDTLIGLIDHRRQEVAAFIEGEKDQ